ncbi:MAG: ABC transporter C-terminal domain-containing protein, partial [Nitrospirota bacterium]|nr:ABC transporter C-terminal domain-containing protein [Nitrospirota bacterium]
ERLSDVLLSLNGDGSVSLHADLAQWRRAKQNKSSIKTTPKAAQAQKQATLEVQEKLSFEERKELKRIAQKIEKAEAKVAVANEALQDPAIQSDAEVLIARTKTLQDAEAKVAQLYTRWEDLEYRNT